jgi:hypothetical protein
MEAGEEYSSFPSSEIIRIVSVKTITTIGGDNMRTAKELDADCIFKMMFSLKQPHELSEEEQNKYIFKGKNLVSVERFTEAAEIMGFSYNDLYYMAHPKLFVFTPIVISDYYVFDGTCGFVEGYKGRKLIEDKISLDKLISQGRISPVFSILDRRARYMSYFKLYDRIPDNQKYDIFMSISDSPGKNYFFTKSEIEEINSYKHMSPNANKKEEFVK